MTLDEIADTLPNGFHDAQIKSINIDYVRRVAILDMEILMADSIEDRTETYRAAQLILSRLLFLVIEAPDSKYPYQEERALWVDAGSEKSTETLAPRPRPTPLPDNAFTHWFFVNNWNAFIHVAAMDAALELH
jgi:hypothetical protein